MFFGTAFYDPQALLLSSIWHGRTQYESMMSESWLPHCNQEIEREKNEAGLAVLFQVTLMTCFL